MTSTERESEQARQLREGVRVVQLEAPAGPDFSKVPVAVATAARKRALPGVGGVVETLRDGRPVWVGVDLASGPDLSVGPRHGR